MVGFTGQERFVELQGFLNARSSAAFRQVDSNVVTVLNRGTRGEILESKKMSSGNYGLRIKVTTGSNAGQSYWVYYNNSRPDLALYTTPPQSWTAAPSATTMAPQRGAAATPGSARGAETLTQVPAIPTVSTPARPPTPREAVGLVEAANRRVNPPSSTVPASPCGTCGEIANLPVRIGPVPSAREGGRPMASLCSSIMGSDGRLGSTGQAIVGIMSEPRYRQSFTAPNALGALCPRFNHLSEAQRLQAFTWMWTSLAQEESGCRSDVEHPTHVTNRRGQRRQINHFVGYGMYAAEKDRNVRLVLQRRGQACADISTPAGQARCAIDTIYSRQLRNGGTATSRSYFGPINRRDAEMMPHMRRFSLCF